MKNLIKAFFIALLFSYANIAKADQVKTWSWRAPTEYNDNTILLREKIVEFRFYCNGVLIHKDTGNVNATPGQVESTTILMETGEHECQVTTMAENESDPSATVAVSVTGVPTITIKPKPITDIKVED